MTPRGWNHCDCCGRFFSPEGDGVHGTELISMDPNGNLRQEWPMWCGPCDDSEHQHRPAESEQP